MGLTPAMRPDQQRPAWPRGAVRMEHRHLGAAGAHGLAPHAVAPARGAVYFPPDIVRSSSGFIIRGLGYRMPGKNETRVAVFLGGRSPEHDVSVVTGLQALKAIDQERFVAFPVYV